MDNYFTSFRLITHNIWATGVYYDITQMQYHWQEQLQKKRDVVNTWL